MTFLLDFSAWNAELETFKTGLVKKAGEKNPATPRPSLRNVLIRTFGASLIPLGLICFVEECVIRYV